MPKPDWNRLKELYITGFETPVEFAKKYSLSIDTCRRKMQEGAWAEKRSAWREQYTVEELESMRAQPSEETIAKAERVEIDAVRSEQTVALNRYRFCKLGLKLGDVVQDVAMQLEALTQDGRLDPATLRSLTPEEKEARTKQLGRLMRTLKDLADVSVKAQDIVCRATGDDIKKGIILGGGDVLAQLEAIRTQAAGAVRDILPADIEALKAVEIVDDDEVEDATTK